MMTEEQLLDFMKNVDNGISNQYDVDGDIPDMLRNTWGRIAVRNGIQETRGCMENPHGELRDHFLDNGIIVYNSGCSTTEGRIPGTVVTFGVTGDYRCFISIREFKHLIKYFAVPYRWEDDNGRPMYHWMIETDEQILTAEPGTNCIEMKEAIMHWVSGGMQQFKREMVPKMLSGDSEIHWLSDDVFCNDDVVVDLSESGSNHDPATFYIRDDDFNDLIVESVIGKDYNVACSEVYGKVREVFKTDHVVYDEYMLFRLVADIGDDVFRNGIDEFDLRPVPINNLTGVDGIYSNSA